MGLPEKPINLALFGARLGKVGTSVGTMADLARLRDLLETLPADTAFTPAGMLELLNQVDTNSVANVSLGKPVAPQGDTWAERLWAVSPDTRLGMAELCEALRRPRSFVYRATSQSKNDPLPGKKFGGEWSFRASDVRAWIARQERQP